MRDFLIGTFGKLLIVIFTLGGLLLLLGGIFGASIGMLIGGIILLCAAGGVKYAMGVIVRHR